jgi:hypothetical protein
MAKVIRYDNNTNDHPARGPRVRWVVAGVAALCLIVASVVHSVEIRSGAGDPTPAAAPSDPVAAWRAGQSDTVVQQNVVPGLARCASRVEGVNQATSPAGVGYKWPNTLEGAVAAAANAVEYRVSLASMLDSTRLENDPLVFFGLSLDTGADEAGWYRQLYGIDDAGKWTDPTTGAPASKFYAAAYPRYGAYRVLEVNRTDYPDQRGREIDEAFIEWWMPMVFGPGFLEDLSQVKVAAITWTLMVVWDTQAGGDYRVMWSRDDSTPQPPDRSFVNQSYQTREDILGPGWCVPLDGIEEPIDGVVKAKR